MWIGITRCLLKVVTGKNKDQDQNYGQARGVMVKKNVLKSKSG